jgi:hypothetical protein
MLLDDFFEIGTEPAFLPFISSKIIYDTKYPSNPTNFFLRAKQHPGLTNESCRKYKKSTKSLVIK